MLTDSDSNVDSKATNGQPEGTAVVQKTFVIDTNVFLHDPASLFQFGDNDVVIAVMVLEELDKMKRSPRLRFLSPPP